MLALILVIINTFHLLDSSKQPFKVTLCWLVAVYEFPQGFSDSQLGWLGRQIGRGFLSFVYSPAEFIGYVLTRKLFQK
jgi:hypothetical protein